MTNLPAFDRHDSDHGVHMVPHADAMRHSLAADGSCECLPLVDYLTRWDGSESWLVAHRAFDRRWGA